MGGRDDLIQLVAGGLGGTTGAIFTCPLEVVKTRLQSSNSGFYPPPSTNSGASSSSGPQMTSGSQPTRMVVPEIACDKRSATTIPVTSNHKHMEPPPPNHTSSNYTNGSTFRRPGGGGGAAFPETWNTAFRFSTSSSPLHGQKPPPHSILSSNISNNVNSVNSHPAGSRPSLGVIQCLRFIIQREGVRGLFKGLGPNLVGVAPSRAIYFWSYTTAKRKVNNSLSKSNRDSPFVHVVSAAMAGFSSSTVTNPLWLVKTRLQLDRASGNKTLTVRKCVVDIYTKLGVFGFWKGVTASYWGISETVIHFVIYESLKKELAAYQDKRVGQEKTMFDFFGYMLCGACSKSCATCVAYPHEVARTRMREEGHKYKSFWRTLRIVYKEEGRRGLYRGLATQLVRQIPNTAIMMSTYELVYYVLTKYNIDGVPPTSLFGGSKNERAQSCDKNSAVATSAPPCDRATSEAITHKTSHSQ